MCRRSDRPARQAAGSQESYEGRTLRLAPAGGPRVERSGACRWHGFPWWALWLLWPLAGLVKWAAPIYLSALAALRAPFGALPVPAAALAAVLLIAAGLWLIQRD